MYHLLGEKMLVCRAAGFIYRSEGSKLAKSLFNNLNCIFLRFFINVIHVSARRFLAAADFALHFEIRKRRCARR